MALRLLFRCSRDFDEMMRETGLTKIELVNVLLYLKRNRLLQKEMNGLVTVYTLNQRGETKLAYYEYNFQCYQRWKPQWCVGQDNGWHSDYCNEMTDLIKKLNYFGYENTENVD